MSKKNDYDVIIIGAGISGLVCGCYLAKAGLKILIVEKNAQAGGYCSSFVRKGFHFDSCVHSLSSLRKDGVLRKILVELNLMRRLKFIKTDLSDKIITPNFKISIFSDMLKTIKEFQREFPEEKRSIEKFFNTVMHLPLHKIRSLTYEELLDDFFKNNELKTIFSVIMLQLLGLPASKLSAMVSCLLWREFLLDGGYYPEGGMQAFSNTLVERFEELNGNIIYSSLATKIILKEGKANGIKLKNKKIFRAKFIVSACDARQTFYDFLKDEKEADISREVIKEFLPSSSGFLMYLGVNISKVEKMQLHSTIYLITEYNLSKVYSNLNKCEFDHLLITSPSIRCAKLNNENNTSIFLGTNAAVKNKKFWSENKKKTSAKKLIKMAEYVFPDLSKKGKLSVVATPDTLLKWTKNFAGAGYGWGSTPEVFGNPDLSQRSKIENLFLTGHWSNQSSGIPFVANCAANAADFIIRKSKVK